MSGRSRDLTGEVSRMSRGIAALLILTVVMATGMGLGVSPALAQSVTLENDHLTIQDGTNTTRVDIGRDVIVEGEEIRVLGPGADIQALIDAAAVDADANKPYRIVLGPGVYTLTSELVMQPFVSLAGSGQEATSIEAGSAIENLVSGADDMAITDLTIDNAGGNATTVAIYNSSASPRIERVTASALGGTTNYGVYNTGSSPVMTDVTASASEADETNYGVYNTGSSPVMSDVSADASGTADATNYGVYNTDSSSPTMTGVTASGVGGRNGYGLRNATSSSPTMTGGSASASGTFLVVGIYLQDSSSVMTDVQVTASSGGLVYGLFITDSTPVINGATIKATGSAGTIYGVQASGSSPVMTGVSITSSGGDQTYGVRDIGSSMIEIKDSVIKAENGTSNVSIDGIDAGTRIYNTVVVGGVANDDAGTQCLNVYDDTPAPIGC